MAKGDRENKKADYNTQAKDQNWTATPIAKNGTMDAVLKTLYEDQSYEPCQKVKNPGNESINACNEIETAQSPVQSPTCHESKKHGS